MVNMKKIYSVLMLAAILTMVTFCVTVASAASEDAISPGPAPDSGDGIPSGNQYIQPDAPGVGPAPNSGDGDPDGSGF
jgi:hypothetical protein